MAFRCAKLNERTGPKDLEISLLFSGPQAKFAEATSCQLSFFIFLLLLVYGVWLPCVCGDLTCRPRCRYYLGEVTHNLANMSGSISPGVPNRVNTTQTLLSPTPLTNSVRDNFRVFIYGTAKKADI